MSAQPQRTVLRLHKPAVVRVPKVPVVLTPIPWGKPDRATGMAVIQNMVDTTPGTCVRWSLRESKLRHVLRSHHFATE